MLKRFIAFIGILSTLALPLAAGAADAALTARLRGYVLLQVQGRGEAWYVNPTDGTRRYLRDGAAAYGIMRELGLGISEADYTRLAAGDASLRTRLVGRIVLRVLAHGEAYYLCPRTGVLAYIKDGIAAYGIMRACGLGITDADLARINVGGSAVPPPSSPSTGSPAPAPSPAPVAAAGVPQIGGCQIFPADSPWNQDVSGLAVHANSTTYINSIGATKGLHPDFGANPDYGIPYNIADATTPRPNVTFDDYGDESDKGPYPIPLRPEIEAGGDQHLLVVEKDECKLYELYNTSLNMIERGSGWVASAGAIWDLRSNALRPENWTSADAAGLPILPGLVRYDEVAVGVINHAIRFTAPSTQAAQIHPATHHAGSNNASLPPMGLRVRLKANYSTAGLTGQALVIATAMKKYGMLLADNGSSWFFQGAYSAGWNDDELNELKAIPGSAFEAVETGALIK